MIHPRHARTMDSLKKVITRIPGDLKYIVIVYDGPSISADQRKSSWTSDAPICDVSAVCGAVSESTK